MKEKTIKELIYKLLEEYKSPSYVSFLLTRAASEIDSMTLDGEEWRPVSGYEGLYSVSNKGRVKSLSRTVSKSTSFRHETADKIMRSSKLRSGYLFVHLTKDGKTKMFPIHRLVAIAFIPNKENLPEVNHKDENKTNNYLENLEWCTKQYNMTYGTRTQRTYKPVLQYDKNMNLVAEYASVSDAAKAVNAGTTNISACAKGTKRKRKGRNPCFVRTAKGFIWRYKKV